MLLRMFQWKVAAVAIWNSGTVGRRLPFWMPATTLTCPVASVDVSVDSSFEFVWLAEIAKSKLSFGATWKSASRPVLRAFGTLKMTRDEHEPAVTVACRSLMGM